ncbi:MAG: DNA primase [Planctomycetota bacterium]|nr:DNA primase [Planctomycetota bacterium]
MQHDDFKSAIEAVKLRAPIEDVVRERVPGLKKSGALWKACCPFHEERTPSFTVDPRRGTWHCFGACGTGGDQISFIQRFDNLEFKDALEILAARTGVTLPKRSANFERGVEAGEQLHSVLEVALNFYRSKMRTSEGQSAVRYLRERGLSDVTAEAFGIGYAPSSGQALIEFARTEGIDLSLLERASLARRNDEGRAYDFFRGRLMIPIKDVKGRVVGFGARRLSDDDEAGPKYVNSAETDVFKKGTLVYALDRAISAVRKSAHIVLVEGYTDVMAAHQCGVATVVAVLGTATTDDHAALIRRTGARRVSLVFDGDEAGRKAAYKALHGLLPLEVEIDVVSLTGGVDPCDLCVKDGAQAFLAELEHARGWFEFLVAGLGGKSGVELSQDVDRVLELMHRLSKPVYRDSRIRDLARELELPVAGLFEQYKQIEQRQRGVMRTPARIPIAVNAAQAEPSPKDRILIGTYEQLILAELRDVALCSVISTEIAHCEDPDLLAIHDAIGSVLDAVDDVARVNDGAVFTALGDSPARARLERLIAKIPVEREDADGNLLAGEELYDRRAHFQGAWNCLKDRLLAREEAEFRRCLIASDDLQVQNPSDPAFVAALQDLREVEARVRERKLDLATLSPVRPHSEKVKHHG